ncbi:MAG: hypothetical protein OIF32_03410 [Campylobacterales bacterium]|nr:hypothetical protein [Campylobacterales bacterium]
MKKSNAYSVDLNKALLFIFISILMTIISIWGFIIPMMKEYKISKITNRHGKMKFYQANEYHKNRVEELKKLTADNKDIIEGLNSGFDKLNFKVTTGKYLTNPQIKYKEKQPYGKYYTQTELTVQGRVLQPKNFFDTILSLNKYENLISIEFPIKFVTTDSKELEVFYPLKLYGIKDLNSSYDKSTTKK